MGSDSSSRIKRRGVRASRIKLEHALAESDLPRKTQAALADRIADIEELDAAPKDLVSKVFRELPVDAQTLERVARALGVSAQSLYLNDGPALEDVSAGKPAAKPSSRLPVIAGIATAIALILVAFSFVPGADQTACALSERFAPLSAPADKLTIVVARLEDDAENMAQDYLGSSLIADQNLAPYLSVLMSCRRITVGGRGDLRSELTATRASARQYLNSIGAHLLIWGKVHDDRLQVRFVSTRNDISPVTVEMAGRPLQVEEASLELQVDPSAGAAGLVDLKRLALTLLKIDQPELAQLRSEAITAYDFSIDWLRASIISQRNLRRRIDRNLDPRRWAQVNAKLCNEQRLLGDYDGDPVQYRQALAACDETLSVRPRAQFPYDWAATQINKSSALIRLHYFDDDQDSAIATLRQAEQVLLLAAEVLDRENTPQLWAVMQRNLGTAYLRLGEVSASADARAYFDRGIARLKSSLSAQDPDFQPLDWAITQQNLCLALYQHGARLGADGIDYVREARDRCEQAIQRLSPDDAALSWAMVQNNLAVATAILADLQSDPDRLRNAIAAFSQAQTVYTRERLPANWAEVELNLGELHCNLANLSGDRSMLEPAAMHSEAALEVFIEKGNRRYQRYAEGLVGAINSCIAGDADTCTCHP